MKIACSIVLYNPDEAAIQRIQKLMSVFPLLIVLDNSSNVNTMPNNGPSKIIYCPYKENRGIAFALNDALKIAYENHCDFLLTLDQDSVYPYELHQKIMKELSCIDLNKDAILALSINRESKDNYPASFSYVNNAITSGNFINLPLIKTKQISFDDSLFIDYVDFDFDSKIIANQLRIKQLNSIFFAHTIGSPLIKRFLFKKFCCMNHSPIRYYYRFRNAYYLYHKNKKYFRSLYFHTMIIDRLKMYIYEPNKKEKIKMIKKGIKDAKVQKLGPYSN